MSIFRGCAINRRFQLENDVGGPRCRSIPSEYAHMASARLFKPEIEEVFVMLINLNTMEIRMLNLSSCLFIADFPDESLP